MKIGILLVATGRYKEFFENFYNSSEENFLSEHEKIYFYLLKEKVYESISCIKEKA